MQFKCGSVSVQVTRIAEDADQDEALRDVCALLSCEAETVRIEKDRLGAPRLICQGRMPAVSLSSARGERWIAMAWAGSLGIDVACPEDFEPPYPVSRVFGRTEVGLVESLGLETLSGYALLWSLKESVAKSLGTGFNGVEPDELVASAFRTTNDGFEVEMKTPGGGVCAVAVPVDGCWLSLSVPKG